MRYGVPVVAALLLLATLALTRLGFAGPLLPWLEATLHDARINLAPADQRREQRSVIVAIDEASLRAEGAWPWPRTRVARLIEQLLERYEAAAVGVDILFPEPAPGVGGDERLAAVVADRRVVLSQAFSLRPEQGPVRSGRLTRAPRVTGAPRARLPRAGGFVGNTAPLVAAGRAGHITPVIGADGRVRRIPPLACVDDACFDMLALALMRVLLETDRIALSAATSPWAPPYRAALGGARTGVTVPLDARMHTPLPYADSARALTSVSAADVLAGRVPPDLLRNRPVIVGATATGLADTIATPRAAQVPGVTVHARLLHALMDDTLPATPAAAPVLLLLVDAAIAAIAVFAFLRAGLVAAPLCVLAAGLAYAAANAALWHAGAIDLPPTEPLLAAAVLVLGLTPLRMGGAERRWRQLYRQFAAYVPPHVIRQLVRSGADPRRLQAQRCELTVLFADLQHFTELGEHREPEQLAALMHRLLTEFTRIIHRHGGTVDKYMGDAIMAFWGAPLPDPDHRRHARSAARDLLATANRLEGELHAEGESIDVQLCIGVHTGVAAVGNFGSAQRRAYTALGDTVNVAARLQALAGRRRQPLVLSAAARAGAAAGEFECLGTFELRGRHEPIRAFVPAGRAAEHD